jgi:ubiquinone biosynthesis protein COQ9
MSARAKTRRDDASIKRAVLEAALPHVPFDGFTDRMVERAGLEAGIGKSVLERLFPEGALDLVEIFSTFADQEMATRVAQLPLAGMKVREKISASVRIRIEILKPNKEAARRAAAFLSLPPHLPRATTLLYNTVDTIWRSIGDRSTDFNFYTKRAILAGVYSATLLRWFNDRSTDESETNDFLAARIENVMQFEKFKAQVGETFTRLFASTSRKSA